MRTLIGGIGYAWQGDLAFGTDAIAALRRYTWPPNVEIADLSHNPIAVFQDIQAKGYEQIVLIGAIERGRPPGILSIYRPTEPLPDPDEIQARIVESGSGIISLDNIVIISRFYGALPPATEIIEVEPVDDHWGAGLSEPVQTALANVQALLATRLGGIPAGQ